MAIGRIQSDPARAEELLLAILRNFDEACLEPDESLSGALDDEEVQALMQA